MLGLDRLFRVRVRVRVKVRVRVRVRFASCSFGISFREYIWGGTTSYDFKLHFL